MAAKSNDGSTRILSVGLQFDLPVTDRESFYTEKHFLDYDLVLLDPRGELKGQNHDYEPFLNDDLLSLRDENGQRFDRRFMKCAKKLAQFIEKGGLAVIFLREMPILQYYDRHDERTVRLSSRLPWFDQTIRRGQGTNIEFSNKPPFNKFWHDTAGIWSYVAICEDLPEHQRLGNVKGHKDEVVAGVFTFPAGGTAVFVPMPSGLTHGREHEKKLKKKVFVQALTDLNQALRTETPTQHLPTWTANFRLPGEQEFEEQISKTSREIVALQQRSSEQSAKLSDLLQHKILVTGFDSALENAVDQALTELGFKVEQGPKKRVDRIATYGDRKLAIEVQGVKRGAKEDHVRALIIWVQDVAMLDGGNEPKGLLVVNPYRDTPLENRDGKNFWPGETIKICKRQGHCALTGLQLLGLYLDAKNDDAKRERLIKKLFETEGLFDGYEDWREFLTPVESKSDDAD